MNEELKSGFRSGGGLEDPGVGVGRGGGVWLVAMLGVGGRERGNI